MDGIKITTKEKSQLKKVNTVIGKIIPFIKWVVIIAIGVFIGGFIVLSLFKPYTSIQETYSNDSESSSDSNCSVLGINLHGTVVTYIPEHAEGDSFFDYDQTSSEAVTWSIKDANLNPDIKAILIEVDSGGGSPVAGEEIANAIKASDKPVVAVIRDTGASAAYWSISSASKIFASANSDVGSIGVTMSYLSNAEKNKKDGLSYENLSSGKYKDSGDPDKALTNEEKAVFMRDINIIFENFVKAVSENRNLPIKTVKGFADGSTVLGEKAKELGMIDEIGGMTEAEEYLSGIIGEKPEVCW